MDQSRRNTLKAMAATGVAIATGQAVQASTHPLPHRTPQPLPASDQFGVQLEHSWGSSGAQVVIKNRSPHATTITAVSPSYLSAEPGLFDFAEITSHGPVTLAAGEEIRVPFKAMATPATNTQFGHFDHTIQKRLRDTLVIETDKLKVASTSVTLTPRIV